MPLTNGIQLAPLHSQSLFQFIHISDACFVHLLLQSRCNQLDSNLANLEAIVGVSFSDKAVVAPA